MELEEDNVQFTPRGVAKFSVSFIIKAKVAKKTAHFISERTSLESDSIAVGLGSALVGNFVGQSLRPLTDKMVDKTADFITQKRDERKSNKSEKDKTEEK